MKETCFDALVKIFKNKKLIKINYKIGTIGV